MAEGMGLISNLLNLSHCKYLLFMHPPWLPANPLENLHQLLELPTLLVGIL